LLRNVFQGVDRGIDVTDAGALLPHCRSDFTHDIGHALDRLLDFLHGSPGSSHQTRARFHLRHRRADQILDLAGRLRTALRERAHFTSHHGKTTPLFSRSCGFHGCIQRQDVGLECDAVNNARDVCNLLAVDVDAVHGGDHIAHHLPTLAGHGRGMRSHLAGLLGMASTLVNRLNERVHGGCCALQVPRRHLGALGQISVALRDFTGGCTD